MNRQSELDRQFTMGLPREQLIQAAIVQAEYLDSHHMTGTAAIMWTLIARSKPAKRFDWWDIIGTFITGLAVGAGYVLVFLK